MFSVLSIRNIDMCAHNSVRAWACCTEVAGGNRGQPRGARRGSNSGRCGCNHRPCLNHCAALSFVRGRWDAATLSSNQCHAKLCSGTRPLAPREGLFRRAMVAQTSRWLPVALPVQPHADTHHNDRRAWCAAMARRRAVEYTRAGRQPALCLHALQTKTPSTLATR